MNFTYYAEIGHVIRTLIIGLGGLGTTFLTWQKIIKPWMTETRKKRDNLAKAISHIESMSIKLEEVSKELKPNGGSSIKDQVKQICLDIKTMKAERDSTFLLSSQPMFKTDNRGMVILANYALCDLFGASPQEMLGLGWTNFIDEGSKERILDEWQLMIQSGTEISSFYIINNPKKNKKIPVKYKAIVNRDQDGIISTVGIVEENIIKLDKNDTKRKTA